MIKKKLFKHATRLVRKKNLVKNTPLEYNKRLSDITASMNYKTLDDSAQGVKIRRSRAYNQGRARSGTGQLGRSMKISTLNI